MPGLCERRGGGEEKNWKKRSRRLNTGKAQGEKNDLSKKRKEKKKSKAKKRTKTKLEDSLILGK